MMSQERWLHQMTKLNKARGNAPHKPLLLLVFLEMVEIGAFVGGALQLSPELAYRFDTFFSIVQHRRTAKPDVRMPFHHLSTQGFWIPYSSGGEISKDRRSTKYIVADPEFEMSCLDPEFRRRARTLLITGNFDPAERNALYHLVGMRIPTEDESTREAFFLLAHDAEIIGRSARFRIDIVSAYNYTCSLTGYRVTTISSGAIVDAAHIHQFSDSRNNDPQNGLALCKNAHWQFDIGLWSIDEEYRIMVAAGMFSEASPNQKPLSEMHGQQLYLPADRAMWPSQKHLAWHRANIFQRT